MSNDILSQGEIDALLASLSGGGDSESQEHIQPSEVIIQTATAVEEGPSDDEKKGYKLYNFRRPDKFSKDHLKALQDIHKEFARQLSLVLTTYLRMTVDVDIVSVDQLTYDEFIRSMPSPMTVGIVELNPLPGQILVGLSHEVTSCIVDRMLGGVGQSESVARELTDIEEALAKNVFERLTASLEESWRNVFPVQSSILSIENSYSMIQIAAPSEIVALLTIEVQVAQRSFGLLSICFPFPVLEIVLSQLSTQHIFQTKGILTSSEDKKKMMNKLGSANVAVNVEFGTADITLKDFLDLKVGDVVKLDNSVNDCLTISLNGEKKFLCRPGTSNKNTAVKVVDIYQQNGDN